MTTPVPQPEPFDLRSHDIADDKRAELLRLFPEARTEGGKIDWERLHDALGDVIDPGRERYGMTWPGKANCFRVIQQPSLGTLLPDRDESVNFDTTENLIIEGDNLEVLKLLQKSYLGKVKMIYIDPPYNTGNDFIYPDDFSESLQTYLEYTGQVDAEGRKFSTNTEAEGRYHSKWLNMMFPRLYLARNLLREDGVIFITVDDTEISNLLKLCQEIFGEEQLVATIVWQKKYSVSNNYKGVGSIKDFVVAFAKSENFENGFLPRDDESLARYANPDDDPRGVWKAVDYWNQASPSARPNLVYPVTNPNTGSVVNPQKKAWKYSREVHDRHVAEDRIWWGVTGQSTVPALKLFLSEVRDGLLPHDWWPHEDAGHTDEAKKELDGLFGVSPFDTPKPTRLISRMCQVGNVKSGDLVFDFFAGSGTTAHAVLDLNNEDGGDRKFILVQLPEPTGRDDYPTIADICKERVRRVIKKLNDEDAGKLPLEGEQKQDRGFRVFKLAESNFLAWNADIPQNDVATLEKQLEMHVDHVRDGRTAEDRLYELLLKSGFPLTTPVETLTIEGKSVYSIAEGEMLVCLDKDLTLEAMRAMAGSKPERVVCLDEGFAGNDQLKANAVQIFKDKGVQFHTV
jgi:Adenine specific DNA methylase Mod